MSTDHAGCPRCGATIRVGSQWCTLCYADLRPAPVPAAVVAPATTGAPAATAAPESVDLAMAGAATQVASRGKHARREPAAETALAPGGGGAAEEDALGTEAMLALLAAESARPMRSFGSRFASSGSKAALMVGGVLAFTVVLFLLMTLVGSLL